MIPMYWLLVAAILIVLEIMTMGLTTIWFAGGALAAAIVALVGFPLAVQIITFVVVSVILLLITRPIAARYLNDKTIRTNVDSLIGQNCLVTQQIDNLRSRGQVMVKGQAWSAKSLKDDVIIPENSIVKVEKVSGVKLLVSVISLPEKVELSPDGPKEEEAVW